MTTITTTTTYKAESKALIIAAFAALYIIWGSTYLAILLAIKSIPPFFMAGTRFLVAGVLLLIWRRFQGETLPSTPSLLKNSFAGVLMLSIGTGAVVWAEQYLPSGMVAIIVATVPLWFVILDKRHWQHYFSNKWIIMGLLTGFAGVMILSGVGSGATAFPFSDTMKLISLFVLIGGTISWAAGSLYSKYQVTDGTTSMKAAVQMTAAGIFCLLMGLLNNEQAVFSLQAVTTESLLALLYLTSIGSLVGYMAYVWLLQVRPASQVGTYAYVNPVVAVFLGWLIVNEPIGTTQVVALLIILTGVILVNMAKEKAVGK